MEMREGNNIVQMGEDVNKVLEEYEKELPDDVSIFRITDQSQVVGDSVTTFLRELLIAIIAVIIVVMLLMPLRVASVHRRFLLLFFCPCWYFMLVDWN